MNTIFLKLLSMGIAAGWLIIAVIIVRLFIKRAPRWIICTLWVLVAIRLCCPFALESSFSLIPRAETIPLTDDPSSQNPISYSGALYNASADISSTNSRTAVSARQPHTLLAAACLIWIAGLCIILCHALISFLRIHHRIQEAVPLQEKIWICDAVRSPFILGFVRPRVYLPSDLEQTQLPYVLAHEQAHLKRRDHWWKFLGYLLLAVYWFQPLVWPAYILFCRDLELACDEKVIRDMDITGKKAYSSALVSCSMPGKMMAVSPLAFGEIGVKERVKTILNYKKPAFWIVTASIILCAVVAVCFLTNPKTDVFDVKIVVPAGSMRPFHYSDMEISPTRNHIILSSGEGLGDTEVVLKTIEVTEENAYGPTYMTPGLAVKMEAERGAWFRIGVAISNPTDEDITVYVHVENVTVRIADSDAAGKIQYLGQWYDKEALSDETVAWLEWYNSLPADEQLMVNYQPYDLAHSLTNGDDSTEMVVDAELPRHPMVLINNMYYYNTSRESTRSDRSVEMDGRITSEVGNWEIPLQNNQSNFGIGYYYQLIDDHTLEILISGKWTVFEAHRNIQTEISGNKDGTPLADTADDIHSVLTDAITNAVLSQNISSDNSDVDFSCCSFVTLEQLPSIRTVTVYGWALYQNYRISENGIEDLGGTHMPVILTFFTGKNEYQLIKYWQPRDGSYYVSDIRAHFPVHIVNDALNSQKYVVQQIQSCYRQAIESSGLDTDSVIENLLDTICSNPKASSNPQDYINANSIAYRELVYYGEYTLRYSLNRFAAGNETGLEGKIMSMVCETLLQTKGQLPLDADAAATGQLWYDTLLAHGSSKVIPYLDAQNADQLLSSP